MILKIAYEAESKLFSLTEVEVENGKDFKLYLRSLPFFVIQNVIEQRLDFGLAN